MTRPCLRCGIQRDARPNSPLCADCRYTLGTDIKHWKDAA